MAGRHRKSNTGMTARQKQVLRVGAVAAPLAAGIMLTATNASAAAPAKKPPTSTAPQNYGQSQFHGEPNFNQTISNGGHVTVSPNLGTNTHGSRFEPVVSAEDYVNLNSYSGHHGNGHHGHQNHQVIKGATVNLFNGSPLVDFSNPGFTLNAETPTPGPVVGGTVGYTPSGGFQAEGRLGVKAEGDIGFASAGVGRGDVSFGYSGNTGVYGGVSSSIGPAASIQDPLNGFSAGASSVIKSSATMSADNLSTQVTGNSEAHVNTPHPATNYQASFTDFSSTSNTPVAEGNSFASFGDSAYDGLYEGQYSVYG